LTDGALQGKAAIVTGAASGIGRAVAERLQAEGMDVLGVDLRPDPDGPGAPYEADLTDADANEAAVNEARERFGPSTSWSPTPASSTSRRSRSSPSSGGTRSLRSC
jgi:NAD(P)-dependent dehydrogenase (short-subunit alcohol dehydrogenase family)